MNIRKITVEDSNLFYDALELLNRTQGRDLFKPTYMIERTSDTNSLVLGAFQNNVLIGLGVAQIIQDQFDYYQAFDQNIVKDLSSKVVGSFSTLCIHEKFQGQGIGKKISQERLEWLKTRNCDVIIGISWVSGLAHTSDRVFEKIGFRAVQRVENFFYQSSIENPFQCPGCGAPPCTCAAIMYRLDLHE